ncbi:DUF3576 domain-containing protein [soil metagenome]
MRFERATVRRTALTFAIAIGAAALLGGTSGCASNRAPAASEAGVVKITEQSNSGGGFRLFGRKRPAANGPEGSLGVNGYLWRAALDTISFMPLASADPYGGLIITDWYANPEKGDERFKATVYILDTRLRADGLNVAIQKQVKAPDGSWRDAAASPQTETDIENAILTRARQLRVNGRG